MDVSTHGHFLWQWRVATCIETAATRCFPVSSFRTLPQRRSGRRRRQLQSMSQGVLDI